jgi:SAM-dependent methyltransferase
MPTSVRQIAKAVAPQPVRWAIRRVVTQLAGVRYRIFGYNQVHAERAYRLVRSRQAKILVVGAAAGADCQRFLRLGAGEVHGLDIAADVGGSFQHPNTFYHRASIECCGLPADQFDLVFSVATMEHVHDIRAGFREMMRVARTGGVIYSIASPLWNSPYGHHMRCFGGHPWVHLVFNRDDIIEYARLHGIAGERGHTIEGIVNYMTDPHFFNMKPARDYKAAVDSIAGIEVIRHEFHRVDAGLLAHPLGRRALALGLSKEELLAETHVFVAGKT